ncbi:MAG: hypothetical protein HOB51_08070 [Thaumarchaeota archaeon]|nr:hypothetical protein [Nitrososphaerota archaeon]
MGIFSRRDKDGYDKDGYDKDGYDKDGYDKEGYDKSAPGYDRDGYNRRCFNVDEIHKVTGTKFDEDGCDKRGYDKDGYNKKGINKKGFNKKLGDYILGYGYDEDGYRDGVDRQGYDKNGFDRDGIHKVTGTMFDEHGKVREFYQFGFDKGAKLCSKCGTMFPRMWEKCSKCGKSSMHFELTSKFTTIIFSFNTEFDAFVTLAYNEPTTVLSKSFFSHDKKTGIYFEEFESFSNNNVVHFHIEKVFGQPPKYPNRSEGDLVSGYTLIVNFNKNDSELKSILIKKLDKMYFASSPSEYTLDFHLLEKYPNDVRAKELLQKVVELFNC